MLKELKTLLPYLRKYRLYYLADLLVLVTTDGGQLNTMIILKKM